MMCIFRRGKELATLPHKADGPGQVSSLTSTVPTYRSYMGLTFFLLQYYLVVILGCRRTEFNLSDNLTDCSNFTLYGFDRLGFSQFRQSN